jgi:hypothetical protein
MVVVNYVFGRRREQDLAGYPSGPTSPFQFFIPVHKKPISWQSAYALLGFYRNDFYEACIAEGVSSSLCCVLQADTWIPTGYLDRPTIEIWDGLNITELLLDNKKPNPWLSRINV